MLCDINQYYFFENIQNYMFASDPGSANRRQMLVALLVVGRSESTRHACADALADDGSDGANCLDAG